MLRTLSRMKPSMAGMSTYILRSLQRVVAKQPSQIRQASHFLIYGQPQQPFCLPCS